MGAPIYQNAAGMGGAMGQVNADIKKKKQETDSNSLEARTKKTAEEKAAKAAEKKRLNTKTKDTEAKTVKQGRLSRKEAVKTAKNAAKSKKKESIKSLDNKKDALNIDAIESSGQKTGYNDTSNRKEARATKRQEMQDIRNEERGARRADRAARKIKRIGDRNNMSVGEATKAYEARYGKGGALSDFQKGERNAKPTDAQSNNDQKGKEVKEQNDQIQIDNVTATIGNNTPDINNPEVLSGIGKMLDGPTQQAASEDSSGMGTYMLDSKNRRGR
jgi:hypothetical protein